MQSRIWSLQVMYWLLCWKDSIVMKKKKKSATWEIYWKLKTVTRQEYSLILKRDYARPGIFLTESLPQIVNMINYYTFV